MLQFPNTIVVLSLKVEFVIMANTADSGEISPL